MFPDDPLSELADKIIDSPVLPTDIAEAIALDVIEDPQGKPGSSVAEILSLMEKFAGITVSPDVRIPDMAGLNVALDHVWDRKKQSFFNGVGIRLARYARGLQFSCILDNSADLGAYFPNCE